MANIRQLKSGNWNVQVRISGQTSRSQTFHTQIEAEDWATELEALAHHTHPTLECAGFQYAAEILAGRPSRELFELQMKRLGRRKQFSKQIHKITLQDLNTFKNIRLMEVSSTTARDDLLKAMRVVRWYIGEWKARSGEEIADPCEGLKLPKPRRVRDAVVTRKQLELLLAVMSPPMAEIVELAYETAMRRSEILKLHRCDIALEERFLRVVDGKEGSRDVPLTKRAVSLLEAAADRCSKEGDKLYPMAPYSVSQAVRRARKALGMPSDVRFHQLRHSRITEVARMGLNQAQIMIVSGHRDIRSVQRYTHLNVKDVINLID